MLYIISLAFTLCVLAAFQWTALSRAGGRTIKSESNFFSSLGRVQAGIVGKPEVMLLGSSITGRIPDRAQGYEGLANLGCDGGSAIDALRAIDSGTLPAAPILVIEANTLQHAVRNPVSEVGRAIHRPWFHVGARYPLLAAYARPSAFLYSKLLGARTGSSTSIPDGYDLGANTTPGLFVGSVSGEISPREEILLQEITAILARLKAKGVRTLVIWLPPARHPDEPLPPWIARLLLNSGAEWWDLGAGAQPGRVALTDGVHLDGASAARTAVSIQKALHIGR